MKTKLSFLLSLACAILGSTTFASAEQQEFELGFTDFESRLASIESKLADKVGVQTTSYSCDNGCCESSCSDLTCCDSSCCDGCCDCCGCGCSGGYYAEVQMNFLRAHVSEGSIIANSKFSEEYELSPRFIVGYENNCGQGARVRYWHHGHHHNNLNAPGGARFEMDVLDIEGTYRAQFCRTDVTLAAGFRAAEIGIQYGNWNVQTDGTIGMTAAVDVRSVLCCGCCSEWSAVYGGRLSILGGDIDGGPQGLQRDMNWKVWELYGGIEHRCCYCGTELYTRLAFEIQNWHADDMTGEISPVTAADTSLGFVGPSWIIGVEF